MGNVAINGFGRIGRATCKLLMDTPELRSDHPIEERCIDAGA